MTEKTILLVGNATIDQVFSLTHFPHENEEMRALDKTEVIGGNACNSAQVLAQLGESVELMCSLADDNTGFWLKQQIEQLGIGISMCMQHRGYATPLSSIWLNQQNASRSIVHYRNLPEISLADLQQIQGDRYSWIHFEGRNIPTIRDYLPSLEMRRDSLSLEIEKPREDIESLLPYVGTVIVSRDYLRAHEMTAHGCIDRLKAINPKLNIVCTLGEEGFLAIDHEGQMIERTAVPVIHVVDTRGAGDCFIAGLISQQVRAKSFATALDYASELAAKKIQLMGMRIA